MPLPRFVGRFVAVALAATAAAAAPAQESPSARFAAIRRETEARERAANSEFAASVPKGEIPPDGARKAYIGRFFRIKSEQASRLVDLAEAHPADPIALTALTEAVWQVNTTPWPIGLVGPDPARPRAFALLTRDHARSDRIGPLCDRIATGLCAEYETFLRAAVATNPHRAVRGRARLALARFLQDRALRLDAIVQSPASAAEFADLFGAGYLARLRRQDRAGAAAEAEALLTRAAADDGDARLDDGGETVAQAAERELFALRHLSVGRPAPELEGTDQDGAKLRLGDYRGKVVLLDFWSEY